MRQTIACATVILGTAALAAQPPALPAPGRTTGPFGYSTNDYKRLLLSQSVQKELELTPEQLKTVKELQTDVLRR